MAMAERRVLTAETSFGIMGLTRFELHEVQCFIDWLRRFSSDTERTSEREEAQALIDAMRKFSLDIGPTSERECVGRARERSQGDGIERNTGAANDGMPVQPGHAEDSDESDH